MKRYIVRFTYVADPENVVYYTRFANYPGDRWSFTSEEQLAIPLTKPQADDAINEWKHWHPTPTLWAIDILPCTHPQAPRYT